MRESARGEPYLQATVGSQRHFSLVKLLLFAQAQTALTVLWRSIRYRQRLVFVSLNGETLGGRVMSKLSSKFVALGILGFAIAPALGQPTSTTIDGYYMANASNSCPTLTTGGFCTATFPAVPTGQFLVVSHVSCLITTIAVATPFVAELVAGSSTAQETFLTNGVGVLFDGTAYYEGTVFVESVSASGTQPLVNVTPLASSASLSLNCTIAGNLHTNP